MNKIVLNGDVNASIDDSIILEYSDKLVIDIKKDTRLCLDTINYCKDIEFNIDDGVNLFLSNICNVGINYVFNLDSYSCLFIEKYSNGLDYNEDVTINLNGRDSKVIYLLKTICSTSEDYKIVINHNAINTSSNIINHGVNIDEGNLVFDVTSNIPRGIIGCVANQVNRIINLTENKCIIRPNLFIDEEDVVANHSALIGKFSDEEMFYIQSRGIDYNNALNLLIKGFLLSGINEDNIKNLIDDKINDNWR